MKILYVAPLDSIHSKRWIQFFLDKGLDIEIIDSAQTGIAELEGAKVHQISWNTKIPVLLKILTYGIKSKKILKRIQAILDNFKPDIIHIHWLAGPFAHAISRLKFHPIISTPWGSDLLVLAKQKLSYRFALNKVIQCSDKFCCDAVHLLTALQEHGAKKEDIKIIYFGTDTKLFHPSKRDTNLSAELEFPADSPLIISNRALQEIYNVETLVRAIPIVIEKIPKARFVIVGNGEQRSMLERLVDDLNVRDYVTFSGRLSDEDIIRYTASASIYVSTSLSDGGLAASTAEAMACGVPVVISDFGQNSEWVNNGEAGLLFPLKDNKKLAANLIKLLNNPQEMKRLGEKGREVILDRNDYYKEMSKVEKMYQQLTK